MSLFDDILDDGLSGSREFGPQEGFAGVLLCASACDGHIGEEEGRNINLVLGRRKLYERLTQQQFGSMMDRLFGELKRGGPEKLLAKSYPAIPPELRETAFANAVDIVLADGTVEEEEREFIDDLQGKLGVDKKRAKAIVQVMVYKNRG
jgi:tellurite resistance protein